MRSEGATTFEPAALSDEAEDTMTLTRADFVATLGEFGAELFDRLDRAQRHDDQVMLLNVREARKAFSSARLPGKGKVVKSQRDAAGSAKLLLMSLTDVADAFKAAIAESDWREVFAPRADLPAATAALKLHRGAPGRRVKL